MRLRASLSSLSWQAGDSAGGYGGMGGVRALRKLVPSCKRLPRPRGGRSNGQASGAGCGGLLRKLEPLSRFGREGRLDFHSRVARC